MKFISFSDMSTQDIRDILRVKEIEKPDVIMYAGDDVERFFYRKVPTLLKFPSDKNSEKGVICNLILEKINKKINEIDEFLKKFNDFIEYYNNLNIKTKYIIQDWIIFISRQNHSKAKLKSPESIFKNREEFLKIAMISEYKLSAKIFSKIKKKGDYRSAFITYFPIIINELNISKKFYQNLIDEKFPLFIQFISNSQMIKIIKNDVVFYKLDNPIIKKFPNKKIFRRFHKEFKFNGKIFDIYLDSNFIRYDTNKKWDVSVSIKDIDENLMEKFPDKIILVEYIRNLSFIIEDEFIFRQNIPQKKNTNIAPSFGLYIRIKNESIQQFDWFWNKMDVPFLYVLGNHDNYSINNKKALNINEDAYIYKNWVIIGSGGVPKNNVGKNEFNEQERYDRLRKLILENSGKKIIILSHTPPYGILDLSTRFGASHIGTKTLSKLIKDFPNIDYILCGHCHMCGGKSLIFQNTKIINIACMENENTRYSIIESTEESEMNDIKMFGINWRKISGIGSIRNEYLPYNLVNDISEESLKKIPQNIRLRLKKYIEFLKNGEITNFGKINMDYLRKIPKNAVFLDIETESVVFSTLNEEELEERTFIASIAVCHNNSPKIEWFFIDDFENCEKMVRSLESYLKCIKTKKKGQIFAWSTFDEKVLSQYDFVYSIEDLIPIVKKTINLPNYALKDVETYLGLKRNTIDIDGWITGAIISHTKKIKRSCKFCDYIFPDLLKSYNIEDVTMIKEILKLIVEIHKNSHKR